MRIALIDTTPKPKVYPVPLLKLGAWRRAAGDQCKLFLNSLPNASEGFDELWLTTCFTFDIPYALEMVRAARKLGKVRVGGIAATLLPEQFEQEGVQVHRGLIAEAEAVVPDYSLLESIPTYSIVHTSRGCIRKCGFCMVPKLEPEFSSVRDWEKKLIPGAKKVLFFDNNWLANGTEDLMTDVGKIRKLVASGQITSVDFNQGLDARIMDEERADLLTGVPFDPIRFAFDGMQEDGFYQRAVRLMAGRGYKHFMTYVLYNFKDTPGDFYYRLRESVLLVEELGVDVSSFPMRFQPILKVDPSRQYIGMHWTPQKKAGFMRILNQQSTNGQLSFIPNAGNRCMTAREEFEYWFGKDAEEFEKLISYPKIGELAKKKKGALRLKRVAFGEIVKEGDSDTDVEE